MQNWQLQQPHIQMKLDNSQQIMQTSKDCEHRKALKPEVDFVLQRLFCWTESLKRYLVTLPVD